MNNENLQRFTSCCFKYPIYLTEKKNSLMGYLQVDLQRKIHQSQ